MSKTELDLGKVKINYPLVSHNNDGLMSKEDKIKLDGIELNGIKFGQDEEGNWGYIVPGADTVIPFKKSGGSIDNLQGICYIQPIIYVGYGYTRVSKKLEFTLPHALRGLLVEISVNYWQDHNGFTSNGSLSFMDLEDEVDGATLKLVLDNYDYIFFFTDSGANLIEGKTITVGVNYEPQYTSMGNSISTNLTVRPIGIL